MDTIRWTCGVLVGSRRRRKKDVGINGRPRQSELAHRREACLCSLVCGSAWVCARHRLSAALSCLLAINNERTLRPMEAACKRPAVRAHHRPTASGPLAAPWPFCFGPIVFPLTQLAPQQLQQHQPPARPNRKSESGPDWFQPASAHRPPFAAMVHRPSSPATVARAPRARHKLAPKLGDCTPSCWPPPAASLA